MHTYTTSIGVHGIGNFLLCCVITNSVNHQSSRVNSGQSKDLHVLLVFFIDVISKYSSHHTFVCHSPHKKIKMFCNDKDVFGFSNIQVFPSKVS